MWLNILLAQISIYMNILVRGAADLELQMNAVERVGHYVDVPTEDYSGNAYIFLI